VEEKQFEVSDVNENPGSCCRVSSRTASPDVLMRVTTMEARLAQEIVPDLDSQCHSDASPTELYPSVAPTPCPVTLQWGGFLP